MFTRIRKKLPVAASALLFLLALPSIATAQPCTKTASIPATNILCFDRSGDPNETYEISTTSPECQFLSYQDQNGKVQSTATALATGISSTFNQAQGTDAVVVKCYTTEDEANSGKGPAEQHFDVKVAGCQSQVASAIANLTPECTGELCQSVIPVCDQCVDCGLDVTPICPDDCATCPACPDCKTACINCGDAAPICPDKCPTCLTCGLVDPICSDQCPTCLDCGKNATGQTVAPICPDKCPTCDVCTDCGTDVDTGQTVVPICPNDCPCPTVPTCEVCLDCGKNATEQTVAPICPADCPCPTCPICLNLNCGEDATGLNVAPICPDKCPTCPTCPEIPTCEQCTDCGKDATGQTVAPICLKDCPDCPVKATPVPSMDGGLCLTATKKSAFANSVITMVDQNGKQYTPQPNITIKTQTALSLTCTQAGQPKPTKCSMLFDFHMSACDCATACPVKCDDRTKQACCKEALTP